MRVIGGVKTLLHDQGMTIRGVQKLFREEGIKHVSSFSARLDGESAEDTTGANVGDVIEAQVEPAVSASAARSSRDAVPDPIIDPDAPAPDPDMGDSAEAAPVFSHQSAQKSEAVPTATGIDPEGDAPGDTPDLVDAMSARPPARPDGAGDASVAESTDIGAPAAPDTPDETGPDEIVEQVAPQNDEARVEIAPDDAAPIEDPAPPPPPSIPETPDVPAADPDDLAAEFARGPGVAARLRLADAATIDANRADFIAAAERLRALLERAH